MMLPLLLSLVVSATDDPPVKVWLNHDNYFQRGDKARVNMKLAVDGYLIVLRADAEGRVRVLFPVDSSDDAFVRGGETIEVRGRGDREAFYVDDREGSGLVLAARSVTPFKFDEFVRGDHWDYRVLSARDAGDDKEAALVDMVQRMTPDGHFDYDDVKYIVASSRAYYDSYYPSYTMGGLGYGWGSPYHYRPYGYAFYNRPHNLFINRIRTGTGVRMYFKDQVGRSASVGGVGPRFRIPQGTTMARGRSGVATRDREAVLRERPDRPTSFPTRDGSVRDRGERPADRPEAREPERRDGGRGADRPADRPRPDDRARPAERPAPERRRDPGSAGGGHGPSGGGGSRGGGGGNHGGGGGGRRRP